MKRLDAPVAMPAQEEVVEDRRVLEEFDVLEGPGNAHLGHPVRADLGDVLVLEAKGSLIEAVEPVDAVEDGRFPGPVGSDDGEDLPLFYLEVDPVQRPQPAETDGDVFASKNAI